MKRGCCAVLVSLLAITLAGCTDDETGKPTFHQESGLSLAMAAVSGSDGAGDYVEYGDVRRLRELGVISDDDRIDPRWQRAVGYGASVLFTNAFAVKDQLGFSPLDLDTALTIGQPPNQAMRISGVDSAGLEKALTKLGAKPRTFAGQEGISLAPDNRIDLETPLSELGIINQLNQVLSVNADTVAASPNAAGVEAAAGPGDTSLYDTEPYGDVADCLGDVVSAAIIRLDDHPTTVVVGVGIRTPKDLDDVGSEVLCAVPADGKQSAVEDALRERLSPEATDLVTNAPMSEYLSGTVVTTSHDCVQATVTLNDGDPVGVLLRGLQVRSLDYWLGGPAGR